jgi:hypothetical protein
MWNNILNQGPLMEWKMVALLGWYETGEEEHAFVHGTLAERDGSVQLTSSLR